MNNLRLFLAFSFLIVFFGCVENEIERYEVQISVEPQGSASISPEIYGPLFPGDSLSITITPVDGFAFDQWSGTINSFEETITSRFMTSVDVKCYHNHPTKNNLLSILTVLRQLCICCVCKRLKALKQCSW